MTSRLTYSALLTFRVDVGGSSGHPRWEAQVVLLSAPSEAKARAAAKKYGKSEATSYLNADGNRVQWSYVDTVWIEESLSAPAVEEPAEVMSWPIYRQDDLKFISKLVKGELPTADVIDLDAARRGKVKSAPATSSSTGTRRSANGSVKRPAATAARSSSKTVVRKTTAKKSAAKKDGASGKKAAVRKSSARSNSRRGRSSR